MGSDPDPKWEWRSVRHPDLPAWQTLVHGRLYRLSSRNLACGVWNTFEGAFYGIRTKFGDRFIDREYHWDLDDTFGTVRLAEDMGLDLPGGDWNKRSLLEWLTEIERVYEIAAM